MTAPRLNNRAVLTLVAITGLLLAGVAGYGLASLRTGPSKPQAGADAGRRVLYWYDPMAPEQRYDRPGKSPLMDMDLVPRYADEAGPAAGVAIDPSVAQNLGARTVPARRVVLSDGLSATGVIDFNQRDVAVVQARTAGFVQRVYGRAPGDVIRAGAPLAEVLAPEWAGAQGEFIAVLRTRDPALIRAARQRLNLLGMPARVISAVERTGQTRTTYTVAAPIGGVVRTLGVRAGMTLAPGQTLAEINGLGTVWLNAAVPEAAAGRVRTGETVTATLTAFPGRQFTGRVSALLPQAETDSRTLTARVELSNRQGLLRPGMFASVQFGGDPSPVLAVPGEAVIRTGRRTLVMLALPDGRFRPAEVRTGREAGGMTEILAGLAEGERVVASGQFLIDSEANLSGLAARPIGSAPPPPQAHPPSHRTARPPAEAPRLAPASQAIEGRARIEAISATTVTLSHDPIPSLGWPAMTMPFTVSSPSVTRGLKVGDRVRFTFVQRPDGAVVQSMSREARR